MYRPDILAKKLAETIIPNYSSYYEKGIIIELIEDSITIQYNNKEYIVDILEESNNIVWEIKNNNTIIIESIYTEFNDIINEIINI